MRKEKFIKIAITDKLTGAAGKKILLPLLFLLFALSLYPTAAYLRTQACASWQGGWTEWKSGNTERALELWSEHAFASDLAPRPARLLYWRVRALEDLGRFAEADALRTKLAKKFPTDFYTFLLFPDGGLSEEHDGGFTKKVVRLFHPRPWTHEVTSASKTTGVAEGVIWSLMRRESKFRRDAVSQSGAIGLMQLMPQTAVEEAVALKIKKSDIYTPEDNILLGASHFSRMDRRFRGNTVKSVAAYNAGAGAVSGWGELGSREWAEWVENIPYAETREFVRSVLENREVYRILYGSDDGKSTLFAIAAEPIIRRMSETHALRARGIANK